MIKNLLKAHHCHRFSGITEAIPHNCSDDVLAMHPSTMNQIGVSLGELVSVNDVCVVPVWPSWSLPLTCVSLGQGVIDCKQLGGEQFSSVQPISTPPKVADELVIKEWYAFVLKKMRKE